MREQRRLLNGFLLALVGWVVATIAAWSFDPGEWPMFVRVFVALLVGFALLGLFADPLDKDDLDG